MKALFNSTAAILAFALSVSASAQEAQPRYDLMSSINEQEFISSEAVNLALQEYNMSRLHKGLTDKQTEAKLEALKQAVARYREVNTRQQAPAWAANHVELPDGDELMLDETWAKFVSIMSGERQVKKQDLSILYPWSANNELRVLADKEVYWPSLLKDLASAEKSIHMQMFGFQDQEITRQVLEIMKERRAKGVEIRIILDQMGARMQKRQGFASQAIIDEMRANGIEVLLTWDPKTRGLWKIDHRKIYIIDGKIGITTGYTMEDHMRNDHFDMGVRTTGELVGQMQMNFILTYLYFGGKLDVTRGTEALIGDYFPAPQAQAENTQRARVVTNIPNVAHQSSQEYYELLGGDSKAPLHIINPYMNDGITMSLLISAAKSGREVNVYTGAQAETPMYNWSMRRDFDKLTAAGVHCFYYHGPDLKLRSHAKGVLVEGEEASVGSTNLDVFSLFQNYEQNVVSDDSKFVEDIKGNVFDYVRQYSKPYEPTKGFMPKLKLKVRAFPGALARFIFGHGNGNGYKKK